MTRDEAIAKANEMRVEQARMVRIGQDSRKPFGVRYAAVVRADDYAEAAREYDGMAERPQTARRPR